MFGCLIRPGVSFAVREIRFRPWSKADWCGLAIIAVGIVLAMTLAGAGGIRREGRMAIFLDAATRKRRTDELKAERQKIEAEMSKVQSTKTLSVRRNRLVEIDDEIKRLSGE